MDDLISIIVPLYNKEDYIEETIENIQNQTYKNWELIIVDDNSTDRSYEKSKKYQCDKIKVLKNSSNLGAAKTRNRGLNEAKGRYICFQDADDLWTLDKLEKQLKFMKEKDCAFSYTAFSYMNKEGTKCKKPIKVQNMLNYKESLKNNRILTMTTMFDTKKIDKALLTMPNVVSEDIAAWWDILEQGYTAYGINEGLGYYRQTKDSLTSNKIKSAKNRWILYRKYKRFNVIKSIYYFFHYAFFAMEKRKEKMTLIKKDINKSKA